MKKTWGIGAFVHESDQLEEFVHESNRIEGIVREVGDLQFAREVVATQEFVNCDYPTVVGLCDFVATVTSRALHPAVLRDKPGMNVQVGDHFPPHGGPEVEVALETILRNLYRLTPFQAHVEYECLHPFTDGNGRSGRVLWLWMLGGKAPLGFLHQWYYQTLEAAQGPVPSQ